jgi:endonuclease YncB( thermonuclease family)
MLRHPTTVFLLATLAAPPSFADVAGPATVVDGDTIVVAGERVRLQGIVASELHVHRLRAGMGVRQVECVGHARDRYGRLLAVCYVGGEDLNERIIREGWALDFRRYSTDYVQAESEAKRAGASIWRSQFTPPWEWRAARR